MFASKDTLLTRPSGYNIARSVRLRSSATAYFNRTLTTPTSAKAWTFSAWIKRGKLGTAQSIFISTLGGAGVPQASSYFTSSDTIQIYDYTGSAYTFDLTTTQVFRDPSAWYHLIFVYDSANATSSSRVRLYVNGVQITSFSSASYPTQNADSAGFNRAYTHYLSQANAQYFDGYLTEINFIDGQALTPSSFGETDSITGVWKPKAYSGTYGTNGFELNFSDNSNNTASTIGKDYSGNGNNWTPNNISVTAGVTYDSMVDSPTVGSLSSNYATLNPLAVGSSGTLSDGSLKIAGVNSTNVGASYSTIGMTTGKWYFEVTAVGVGSNFSYALVEDVVDTSALNVSGSIFAGYRSTGDTYGTVSIATTTWNSAGVVIGVAVDCDNGAIYFANANTWINSGVPTSGASRTGAITTYTAGTKTLHGGVGCYQNSSQSAAINFGQRPFSYTPPTGFVALNTYNLPASTIKNGAAYMAATLYTGNASTQSITNTVNGVSFQPDFVWAKARNNAFSHKLFDSVRGIYQKLASESTSAEATETAQLTAFNSNGFTLGNDNGINGSGSTFVGWQWKAGGTSASNTNGSITSTVSSGATQGFSVVTYTGTGANATVGHGLGVAPSFIIVKSRSVAGSNWPCYHVSTGNLGYNYLNLSLAVINNASYWNSTSPTSTVFSLGNDGASNQSAATYVAYCFSAVAGYSAFGSYTGNGSTDGAFVYLGFRPRFVIFKASSTGGANYDWFIEDSSRSPSNQVGLYLAANLSDADTSNANFMDFLSNGFKMRSSSSFFNGSGTTYIYMAFAENPFKHSLAR